MQACVCGMPPSLPPAPLQDKSSRGSVDTTKTRSGPRRVRMCSGERPIGVAKGKQSDTEALCQPPPPLQILNPDCKTPLALSACRLSPPTTRIPCSLLYSHSVLLSSSPRVRLRPQHWGGRGLHGADVRGFMRSSAAVRGLRVWHGIWRRWQRSARGLPPTGRGIPRHCPLRWHPQ